MKITASPMNFLQNEIDDARLLRRAEALLAVPHDHRSTYSIFVFNSAGGLAIRASLSSKLPLLLCCLPLLVKLLSLFISTLGLRPGVELEGPAGTKWLTRHARLQPRGACPVSQSYLRVCLCALLDGLYRVSIHCRLSAARLFLKQISIDVGLLLLKTA